MKRKHQHYLFVILLLCSTLSNISCKKFLDENPIDTVLPLDNLDGLQAILDNRAKMNDVSTQLNELIADNFYVQDDTYNKYDGLGLWHETKNYIWAEKAVNNLDWENPYLHPISYANVVLYGLADIKGEIEDTVYWNSLRGAALFYRAFAFERLAQLYCRPYDSSTANTDNGIVLKITSSPHEEKKRSTVQQTYDRITGDLKLAAILLPGTTAFITRPNKAAAYAALARTYLSMRDYNNAGHYAGLALKLSGKLVNYNDLLPVNRIPIESNSEIIYYSQSLPASLLRNTNAIIDSGLYRSYDSNDCRKTLFFMDKGNGKYGFRGSYAGAQSPDHCFDGLATDEMYLIRAECYARSGDIPEAMKYLDELLKTRWKNNGTWQPAKAANRGEAIDKILLERRKELVYRGLRWSDLRRRNLEGANIYLTRKINGDDFSLAPGEPRWVMQIPE